MAELLTYVLIYISSTIGCVNFGPDWSWLKCTKFDQLILRKIIKIVATTCQISIIKIDFGWGSAPDPAGGAYSTPPDPLAGFKGPTSKGTGGEGRRGKGGGARPVCLLVLTILAAGLWVVFTRGFKLGFSTNLSFHKLLIPTRLPLTDSELFLELFILFSVFH